MIHPTPGLKPAITIDLNRPDGTKITDELSFKPGEFSADTQNTNVMIADNYFRGDLKHYSIKAKTQNVKVEIESNNLVPAWRPATGKLYFGDHDEYNFSWLPATPRGNAKVKLTINGKTEELTGICYHDHNWGDIQMLKLMHHWYWGRANIDDYTVISSYITAEKKYGYQKFPIFMVAKNNQILTGDVKYLTYTESNLVVDEKTQKPVHHQLCYDYDDKQNHFKVTYSWGKTILNSRFADNLPPVQKAAAKLSGMDGAYLRFSGKVTLEVFDKSGKLVETHTNNALWEEMYFGKTIK